MTLARPSCWSAQRSSSPRPAPPRSSRFPLTVIVSSSAVQCPGMTPRPALLLPAPQTSPGTRSPLHGVSFSGGISHLPPLQPTSSSSLPLSLTSPGGKTGTGSGGGGGAHHGFDVGGGGSSAGNSPLAAAAGRQGGLALGGGGGSSGTSRPDDLSLPSPSDWRPRSGRFSRCNLSSRSLALQPTASTPVPATAGATAGAAGSRALATSSSGALPPTASRGPSLLDCERRSFSHSELPDRVVSRTSVTLAVQGPGSGGGGSAAGGLPLRRDSSFGGDSVESRTARGALAQGPGLPAAYLSSDAPAHRQNGPHPHPHPHPLPHQHHFQHCHPPTAASCPLPQPRMEAARTRLGASATAQR